MGDEHGRYDRPSLRLLAKLRTNARPKSAHALAIARGHSHAVDPLHIDKIGLHDDRRLAPREFQR